MHDLKHQGTLLTLMLQTPRSPRRPLGLPLNLQLHPLPPHVPRGQDLASPGPPLRPPRPHTSSHSRRRTLKHRSPRHPSLFLPHNPPPFRPLSPLRLAPPTPRRTEARARSSFVCDGVEPVYAVYPLPGTGKYRAPHRPQSPLTICNIAMEQVRQHSFDLPLVLSLIHI